jgi:hypothetical protein
VGSVVVVLNVKAMSPPMPAADAMLLSMFFCECGKQVWTAVAAGGWFQSQRDAKPRYAMMQN